ncbi:MAG: hypothetical protein M3332_08685 [Actinomycetota bacterium]|nr:hypothetical protein [Actinomycetota bacterium]
MVSGGPPPPSGDATGAELARTRRRALEAAVQVWTDAGWPRTPLAPERYEQLQTHLCDYLEVRFANRFSQAEKNAIVIATLISFMAPLYARPLVKEVPNPGDLLHRVEDEALGRLAPSPSSNDVVGFRSRSVDQEDEALCAYLFSYHITVSDVKATLEFLVLKGEVFEYLAVTQYLDLANFERTRRPLFWEVVDKLKPLERKLGIVIDEHVVQAVLLRFWNRLPSAQADK